MINYAKIVEAAFKDWKGLALLDKLERDSNDGACTMCELMPSVWERSTLFHANNLSLLFQLAIRPGLLAA